MSSHTLPYDLLTAPWHTPDPGNAGTINIGAKGRAYVPIVTAAAETRTLAAPSTTMQQVCLFMKTDGGDCTITVNSGQGVTTLVLSDAGDATWLEAIDVGGTVKWRVIASRGVGQSGVDAADVAVADSGDFTSADDVEEALAEIYQHLKSVQAQINVDVGSAILAAGTPMAAWADNAASNPGVTLTDSEMKAIRWNNNGTQTAIWYSVPMPQDLDDTADLVLHILASKSGATVGDAVTFTVTAFFQTVGALHDADANAGGASSAMTGDATAKTVQEETLTIAAADVPASPSNLSFSIKPTDGTLGTDDVMVCGLWFEYKRKILTS